MSLLLWTAAERRIWESCGARGVWLHVDQVSISGHDETPANERTIHCMKSCLQFASAYVHHLLHSLCSSCCLLSHNIGLHSLDKVFFPHRIARFIASAVYFLFGIYRNPCNYVLSDGTCAPSHPQTHLIHPRVVAPPAPSTPAMLTTPLSRKYGTRRKQ